MTRDDWIQASVRLGFLALIFVIGGLIEPCDNEPRCHAPKEFKHEIK